MNQGDAIESEAVAGARRQGVAVVVGSVITRVGDHDGAIWTSRDGAAWAAVKAVTGGQGEQRITSVAGGPLGFVAAGVDGRVPAVWFSPDGVAWARAEGPFLDTQRIKAVAVGPSGAVAVGTITTSGDVDGMAWFSADGTTWRTVPLGGPAGFTGRTEQTVHGVTATAGGFLAVGDDADGERRAAVAWTSTDGISWQRQPAGELVEAPGNGSTQGVHAYAVAGSGPVVAVGGSAGMLVWTSPDGRRWTREEAPPLRSFSERSAVATDGKATIASDGLSALWFRAPGAAWLDVAGDRNVFPSPSRTNALTTVARVGTGFLAVGNGGGKELFWRSPDGLHWEAQDAGGAFSDGRVDALAVGADVVVAVGTGQPGASAAGNTAAAWWSDDQGASWHRADPGNTAFSVRVVTQMFGVTAGVTGFVGVGLSYDGNEIDAQAWYSPDGRSWRRASEPSAWKGPGDQTLNRVCPLPGGGFVALGTVTVRGDQDVWAWVSADGMSWERAGGQGAGLLAGPGLQFPVACVTTPREVLVAGRTPGPGGTDDVVWATTDGREWRVAGDPDEASSQPESGLSGLAVDGDRMAAGALEGDDIALYTSPDGGHTWARRVTQSFAGPGLQAVRDIFIAGDQIVLAGNDNGAGAIWVGPAP